MSAPSGEHAQLRLAAQRFSLELSEHQVEALERYLDLLLRWRSFARLVSRRQTRTEIIRKHVADSFAVVEHLTKCRRIADIGSGAGFPGISIAIALSDSRITLVEPNRRKANFLREVVRTLSLTNVSVVETRAEDAVIEADAAVSRAVWPLAELLDRVRDLVVPGGLVVAMKGPTIEVELAEVETDAYGFSIESKITYGLKSGEQRVLVLLRRQRST
ncbi:MAG: 16S rRNA (guanine(527)-N(7))-methyltransferase RsmG [Deltaproteobacteria bacterium]|nr:16S rRNA (guanine(527)-N(7))-methyltransferase RsmG [Deltaproteobacteria bacterium]MBI3390667.1 16S rRNA (guanine(527)-N(7))-methyltransferase RsmG [Deltaproteobacteria bacterium]